MCSRSTSCIYQSNPKRFPPTSHEPRATTRYCGLPLTRLGGDILPYGLRSHQASSQHEQPALKPIINKLRPKHLVHQERSNTEPIGSSSKTKDKRQTTKSVEDERKGLKTDIVGKAPSLKQREAAAQALQKPQKKSCTDSTAPGSVQKGK